MSTLDRAAAWLEAERPNLDAAADYAAASSRHLHAVQIPAAVGDFLRAHGDWDQALELHRTALTAARRARDGQALALRQLGIISWLQGNFAAAADLLAQAAELYQAAGDKPGEAYVLAHIGKVQELTGDYPGRDRQPPARPGHRPLRARPAGRGERPGPPRRNVRDDRGPPGRRPVPAPGAGPVPRPRQPARRGRRPRESRPAATPAGDYQASIASSRGALAIYREQQHRPFQPATLNDLGLTLQLAGDFDAALDCLTQALEQVRDLGIRIDQAMALNSLGELACRTSHPTGHATTTARHWPSPVT